MPYSRRGNDDERNCQHAVKTLSVILKGSYAGEITVFRGGYASFLYDTTYSGPSLSVHMPVGSGPFYTDILVPWIEGLLPDNPRVRQSMAREASCSATNPFELLEYFGRDCPGAVQICSPLDVASVLAQEGDYEPVSDAIIGSKLKRAQSITAPTWIGADERWSLGGAQGKISLARINGHWNLCHGSAATTHLLKPGVEGFSLQSLDEYLCMRLAWSCGLSVPAIAYEEFAGTPSIVIERYDRVVSSNGTVERLHQEDLCQALGYLPEKKYEPTPSEIIYLLSADESRRSITDFVRALFFNYLIGATDAHAKNYSLMHLHADDTFLAPLYDVASILPYRALTRKQRHAAMPIGRGKVFGKITGSNIDRFASNNNLDSEACRATMAQLASDILEQISDVVNASAHIAGIDRIGPELVRTVSANCEAMLRNMNRDGHSIDTSLSHAIDSGRLER